MDRAQEHLQTQGRSCYKRKDFQKALDYFDQAVGRAPSVQLLDNRAACHDKLGNLPAALRDAKKAIQLQREDPTGYLRAGRVLIKMEKQSVALEIYSHGIRTVKHVGQGFELLRKEHDELSNRLSPPKSVDPLTVLPCELAEYILELLTFRQRMIACRVSKDWAFFIRSTPNLWQHLDLSDARRVVKNKFISRAINIGRVKLKTATLSNLQDFDRTIEAIVRHCPLEDLTLLDTGLHSQGLLEVLQRAKQLKHLRVGDGTEIGPTTLDEIVKSCAARLVTLDVISGPAVHRDSVLTFLVPCEALTTLELVTWTVGQARSLERLLKSLPHYAPNLQRLLVCGSEYSHLHPTGFDWACFQHLKHLDLRVLVPDALRLALPPTIETLSLGRVLREPFWTPSDAHAPTFSYWLPHLTDLSLRILKLDRITPFLAQKATTAEGEEIQQASNIRRLCLGPPAPSFEAIDDLITHPRVQDLEVLVLRGVDFYIDHMIELVAARLKKLRTVDLSGTDVDGWGVRKLVEQGGVRHLILNDCRRLGADAVDWARSQGVRVDARTRESTNGGRKVRHS